MPSFDIVSKADLPSVKNAIDGVQRGLILVMILKAVNLKLILLKVLFQSLQMTN